MFSRTFFFFSIIRVFCFCRRRVTKSIIRVGERRIRVVEFGVRRRFGIERVVWFRGGKFRV